MSALTKKEIRCRMKELETAFLATDGPETEAEAIWSRVEASEAFINADTVLLYMAIPGEVPTQKFIDRWYGRKRLVIPKVQGDELGLYEYSPEHLTAGYRGIMEPGPDAVPVSPDSIDLALVPGVAFTRKGDRLGRGKGFYDRLLSQMKCPCAGIGYSFRWIKELPTDEWDARLSMISF